MSATRIGGGRLDETERYQVVEQSLSVGCSLGLLSRLKRFTKEGEDFSFGAGGLEQHLQYGGCCRIEQMRVPREGIEDDCLVFEVT